MNPNEIKIDAIGGSGRHLLRIEGTVLVYENRLWTGQTEHLVPVELLALERSRAFDGRFLIAALLCLVFGLLGGVLLNRYLGFVSLGFFYFLIVFLRRCSTIELLYCTNSTTSDEKTIWNTLVVFWEPRHKRKEVEGFLDNINKSLELIDEYNIRPARWTFTVPAFSMFRVALAQCSVLFFLFLYIGGHLKKPVLLLFSLAPLVWYLYRRLRELKQPRLFRLGLTHYRKKQWNEAINVLDKFLQATPHHAPSIFLLVNCYVRVENFNQAIGLLEQLPDEFSEVRQTMQNDLWECKRIWQRRHPQDSLGTH